MSNTASPAFGSRAITGIMDTASCLVRRPVSCNEISSFRTSPSAPPRSKGITHEDPGPRYQLIGSAPTDRSQASTESLSFLSGLTLIVSGSLSKDRSNHVSASCNHATVQRLNRLLSAETRHSESDFIHNPAPSRVSCERLAVSMIPLNGTQTAPHSDNG